MSYSNILKNIVDDAVESSSFNVNNRLIITQELCDFETNIDLSNNNILNVNTISPCTQINCGNLTLTGNTINNTSGVNMLINNVQKINNKLLPSGDFFGKEDLLTLSQIPDGLITTNKIARISNNTFLGNNSGVLSSPIALTTDQVKTMLNISNQTITLSGDITGSGTTSISATLNNSSVTLAKMADLAVNSIIGNNTAFSIAPKALNASEVRAMLSINSVDNVSINSWTGSTNITTLGTIPNLVCDALKVNTGLNMSAKAITSCLSINGNSIPISQFVGINDVQTLTNKSINGTQITTKSLVLDKLANISTNTLLGNNVGGNNCPIALSISDVKTMLGLVNNVTLGNLNINNNDITCSSGILNATVANINLTTATLLSIAGQKITFSTTNLSIDFNENTSSIDVTGVLNMKNYNITNIGNINGVSIPNSAIVGISSNQTLTNKIINGDQLVLNSVALSRLTSIDAQSFLGNREFTTGVPQVLSATQAKTILSLQNVQNIDVTNWAGSTNITTVGNLSSGSLASGFGNVNCGTISCTSLSSKTRLLTLNGVGADNTYPAVVTNNAAFLVSSNVANQDSMVVIDGPTTTNGRYIACNQNGTYKLAFGLRSSDGFFIYDPINDKTLLRVNIGQSNPIQFPSYTTDGTMSFSGTNGTVIRSSDRRLKENEELLIPAVSLQKIMNLQPKKYNWISEPNRVKIGFIAQDIETAIPEAVDGKKFEYEFVRDGGKEGVDGTVRLDEEGKPVLDYDKPRYRGLDQCAILSVLVSAFQELVQKNNLLEARINELDH